MRYSVLYVLLASVFAPALAVQIFSSPEDLEESKYDFVVVGGGTAVRLYVILPFYPSDK